MVVPIWHHQQILQFEGSLNVPLLEGLHTHSCATFYFKTRVKIGQGGLSWGYQKVKGPPVAGGLSVNSDKNGTVKLNNSE